MPSAQGSADFISQMTDTNYFVCTLGQAAQLHQTKPYRTIPELIDHQAAEHPTLPAVGFYDTRNVAADLLTGRVHDFKTVQQGVRNVAKTLQNLVGSRERQTVVLLCPSSAAFLYAWLALIYLGHSVLLIAPQCSPSAVSHLCNTCGVSVLLYDEHHEDLASKACSEIQQQEAPNLKAFRLPFSSDADVFSTIATADENSILASRPANTEVAYLHHTSGTSTGLPKPIPQTHHGGLGVLPILDGTRHATFTTTPLYHGGVADLFRAWTSNALVWLFPGSDLPITASNIIKFLDVADESFQIQHFPPVRYFSSVPYVLQMMAAEAQGLGHLRSMDVVGVGGAALPSEVGDDLVHKGVKLVSRFGSAECGFLLSSYRDFSEDGGWQYLRFGNGQDQIALEGRSGGLHELIVKAGWPHMAKRNREDGAYATSDLFEAHPSTKDAWKYHSRADSQLTLITGKKFDPAPLEAALAAASSSIVDVLIFGNGRPYPGALLFRSVDGATMSDEELVDDIAPHIERLNAESQGHARLSKHMLVPMPYSRQSLEKSSKGTIMRSKAEETYADVIAGVYDSTVTDSQDDIPDSEVPRRILEVVNSTLGNDEKKVTAESDLFANGIDSVASIRIRQALSTLLPQQSSKLPLTVVQDSGTVSRLSDLILRIRHGKPPIETEDQSQLMQKLVLEYGISDRSKPSSPSLQRSLLNGIDSGGVNILLTGPTGSLGSHLLHQLLENPLIKHIYLLVRGASSHAARERVVKALTSRSLSLPSNFDTRVTIMPCKLSSPDLGLSSKQYRDLAERVDVVVHLAWAVNFLLPLRTFSSHLSALRHLLDFALASSRASPPRFLFCSTVAAVSRQTHPISETTNSDPSASGQVGYAQSKWVAEQICASAHVSTRLHGLISVVRVGQLSGATETGAWAKSEAYPLILSTLEDLECLPDLDAARRTQSRDGQGKEELNWLPVDTAAKAFVELIISRGRPQDTGSKKPEDEEVEVYHLLSPPHIEPRSWSDLADVIFRAENNSSKLVPVHEWLDKLEDLRSQEQTRDHPALRLVSFWREAYAVLDGGTTADDQAVNGVETQVEDIRVGTSGGFRMTRTLDHCTTLRDAKGLDDEYILKIWGRIKSQKTIE